MPEFADIDTIQKLMGSLLKDTPKAEKGNKASMKRMRGDLLKIKKCCDNCRRQLLDKSKDSVRKAKKEDGQTDA